jgi:Domain of unknown function (DUF4166)
MTPLYRRLLGPAYDSLPPVLREFHDVATEWQGRSSFRITRGPGWLRNLLANVAGFPKAGANVPVHLRVVAEGDRERWIRHFAGKRMESVQWAWNGLLMEKFGPATLGMRLIVEPPALRLVTERVWVLGVPWLAALAPGGDAIEVGQPDGNAVVVRVSAPLVGLLVQYEGLVVPLPPG